MARIKGSVLGNLRGRPGTKFPEKIFTYLTLGRIIINHKYHIKSAFH